MEAPDHGEVWTIPWESSLRDDTVTFSVHGIRFPYRLRKTVSLRGDRLVAHYTAENLSCFPMDFIWAAHPLFNASHGMRFIVPPGMTRIVNAVPGPTLGGYGERYDFPRARRADGVELDLDRVPPRNGTGFQKYWFANRVTEGWCILHDAEKGLNIGMTFPVEKVPYLGMWLNEGGLAGQYNVAPEPATGAMDRIDLAKIWGMGSVLKPGTAYEWGLTVKVAEGRQPLGMTPGEEFQYTI
jgi:galactose mutarotase-like enzyme